MAELTDDFMAFLPRLIGAAVIATIGAAIFLLGPILLYRRFRQSPDQALIVRILVGLVFWTWTLMTGLVIFSLAINTLGVDSLQSGFDEILTWIPKVVVSALILLVGSLPLLLFAAGTDYLTRSVAQDARRALSVFGWFLQLLPAGLFVQVALNTVGVSLEGGAGFLVGGMVALLWILALRAVRKRGLANWFVSPPEDQDAPTSDSRPPAPVAGTRLG